MDQKNSSLEDEIKELDKLTLRTIWRPYNDSFIQHLYSNSATHANSQERAVSFQMDSFNEALLENIRKNVFSWGCPEQCFTCNPSEDFGGAQLINARCTGFCSKEGYCGISDKYKQEGSVNCQGCKHAEHELQLYSKEDMGWERLVKPTLDRYGNTKWAIVFPHRADLGSDNRFTSEASWNSLLRAVGFAKSKRPSWHFELLVIDNSKKGNWQPPVQGGAGMWRCARTHGCIISGQVWSHIDRGFEWAHMIDSDYTVNLDSDALIVEDFFLRVYDQYQISKKLCESAVISVYTSPGLAQLKAKSESDSPLPCGANYMFGGTTYKTIMRPVFRAQLGSWYSASVDTEWHQAWAGQVARQHTKACPHLDHIRCLCNPYVSHTLPAKAVVSMLPKLIHRQSVNQETRQNRSLQQSRGHIRLKNLIREKHRSESDVLEHHSDVHWIVIAQSVTIIIIMLYAGFCNRSPNAYRRMSRTRMCL